MNRLLALVLVSAVYLVVFVVAMAVLYHFFGGHGCGANTTIITISLVGVVLAIVVQLGTAGGSIIASGILAAYVAYLTYVSVSQSIS